MSKKETILVTGGLGGIGNCVVRELLKLNYSVVIADVSRNFSLISDVKDDVAILPVDILDLSALLQVIAEFKVERIIHMAAVLGTWYNAYPVMSHKINLEGTINILEAAKLSKLKRVIVGSSKGAVGDVNGTEYAYPECKPVPEEYRGLTLGSPYGIFKFTIEQLAAYYTKKGWVEVAATRLGDYYGPERLVKGANTSADLLNEMVMNAYAGKTIEVPSESQKWDLIYSVDVARAIIAACFKDSISYHVYNVSSGRGWSLDEVCGALKKVFPNVSIETSSKEIKAEPIDTVILDNSRLRTDLEFEPEFDLEKGIIDYISRIEKYNTKGVKIVNEKIGSANNANTQEIKKIFLG